MTGPFVMRTGMHCFTFCMLRAKIFYNMYVDCAGYKQW